MKWRYELRQERRKDIETERNVTMYSGLVSGRPEVPPCSAVTKTLETFLSGKNLRLTITLRHSGWTISNRCSKSLNMRTYLESHQAVEASLTEKNLDRLGS